MTFGDRWSIGKKLGVCFASTSLLLLILGLYTDTTIARLGKSEDLAVNGLARLRERLESHGVDRAVIIEIACQGQ